MSKLVEQRFEVPSRDTFHVDLLTVQPSGTYLSAMVEITGGGGFVEQQADHPDGSAVSPCSNSTSGTWYFADNYTLNDSKEDLVITNPFPDDAIVDFTFNLGAGRLQTSTLRRRVNQRDWTAAGQELRRWVYGGGKVLPGLVARRAAECALLK